MEQPGPPTRPSRRSHQLVLPLAPPGPAHHPPPLPVASVTARQVWASLGPTGQGQLHRLLLRIVREVVHEPAE